MDFSSPRSQELFEENARHQPIAIGLSRRKTQGRAGWISTCGRRAGGAGRRFTCETMKDPR